MKSKSVINQTIGLYSNLFWKNIFAKIRFWDAPYVELEKIIPQKGKIIDLGCGDGIFANFLALSSQDRDIIGIEKNKNRIKDADKKLKNTKFFYGDITKKEIPQADVIILIHVLHHLNSFKDQEKLIEICRKKLKKNGRLILAEIEPEWSIKFFTTWFTDHFLVAWLFENKLYQPIYFRTGKDWIVLTKKIGFNSRYKKLDKGKPFSHSLIDCTLN